MSGAFNAARRFGNAAKSAGHQEDEQHNGDVHITDVFGTKLNIAEKIAFAVLKEGDNQRQPKGYDYRHDIEAHLSLYGGDVFIPYACSQIQYQEDENGQQGRRPRLGRVIILFHEKSSFIQNIL